MSNLKNYLKYIPGFRSNKKWKMIIASIYYLFCLLMIAAGLGYFLFMAAIPFLIFNGKSAIKYKTKSSIIASAIFLVLLIVSVSIIPNTNTTKTSQNSDIASNTQTDQKKPVTKNNSNAKPSDQVNSTTASATANTTMNGTLKIHYINVGQGDSILVQQGSQNMLIDTGTNASTNSLISYLQSQNINRIDYLILTHPHEDHIGGADVVINAFNIGTVYMPKVTSTTKTFKDVVNAMSSKGLKATSPTLGSTFKLGEANCIVYGPINPESNDLNTYSIVIKLTFGNTKFLFTGDAQASNEEGMIANAYDLSADVLKVGHHGSHTSTSEAFLNKVNPKYAVISVGKGNDYGHPHEETMNRLKEKGIKVYRTDENRTIICTSDGKNISFNCNPGDYTYGSSSTGSSSSGSPSGSGGSNPKPAPTPTPTPAPSSNASISAGVSNSSPAQNSTESLTVSGPAGAKFTAVCHYSSKDTTLYGTVGNPISFKIGTAKKGFKVVIDITVTYNGKTYQTQTSFTPQ